MFFCGRFFSLGTLQYTMLHSVYQPMIGTLATSLYHVLHDSLPAHQVGYSPIEPQRKLFLSLQLEQGAEGRRKLIESTSRLEAVGLLSTSRSYVPQEDDYVYIYHLHPPLSPQDFFNSHHLVFLLRDTIGQPSLMRLKERLFAPYPLERPAEDAAEDLTVPFYELFRLNPDRDDAELVTALDEMAAGNASLWNAHERPQSIGYPHAEILRRFPRASRNRRFVENLGRRPDQLGYINYTAAKYRLELQELCRLLDEDDIFDEAGELNEDVLAYRASLSYMQRNKRREEREMIVQRASGAKEEGAADLISEKPVDPLYQLEVPPLFAGRCDQQQYNLMLRNEPYTRMLERFFQGEPSTHAIRLFERMHLSYKMPDEVINVIMHYIHTYQLSWSKAFVESIFTDLMARNISTFEGAVGFIRERLAIAQKSREKSEQRKAASAGRPKQRRQAPAIVTQNVPDDPVTDEEFERILQKVRNIESKLK